MKKDKQEWISKKIKKLRGEGMPQDQAIAVAYNMHKRMLQGGTYEDKPKYQQAGTIWEDSMNQMGFNFNPQDMGMVWNANLGQYMTPPTSINQSEKFVPYVQDTTVKINTSELDNIPTQRRQEPNVVFNRPNEIVNVADTSVQGTVQTPYTPQTKTNQIQQNNIMFNPFGGIGLEQSLAYAGQGFGSGQTGKGVMGATLSGLKGTRTFMSGFATGKENKRQDEEYRRNMQEEPRYIMNYQDGGYVAYTEEDIDRLNDATGLSFTKEGAEKFDPKAKPMKKIALDLGRYKDVDYFNVIQKEDGYIIRPSKNNKKGFEEYKNDMMYIKKLNPNAVIKGYLDSRYFVPLKERKQQGGEITNSEVLTGEYLVENPELRNNVELESGEYTENAETGNIQEVVGEKHDNGGVNADLPNGSKVISDYTKIGKDNAKKFKEEFDIKIKATDTFATVLDKVNQSIGLDDIIEEEKEIYEKIEAQSSDSNIKENVKNLNLTALQKRLQEIGESKESLKQEQKKAFDRIFEEQEKIPKKKDNDQMKYGGMMDKDIDFLSKKYKIEKDTLRKLMSENELQVKQDGGMVEDIIGDAEKYPGLQHINESNLYGDTTLDDVANLISNNKGWYDFSNFDPTKKEDVLKFQKAYNQLTPGRKIKEDGQLGEQTKTAFIRKFKIPYIGDETSPVNQDTQQTTQGEIQQQNQQQEVEKTNRPINIPLIPQDFILPPSARQPVYKQSVELGRIDPIKVSAEPNLVEIERQRQALDEATRFLPPAQRASVMANALGQTQSATNQAISQTEATNAQAQYNADLYNLQARAKEDLLNARFEQDYEAKTMAAIGNQEMDIRAYFNDLNAQQHYNFDYIDRRNLLNQIYPQYNVMGSSNVEFAGAPDINSVYNFLNPTTKPISEMTKDELEQEKIKRSKFYAQLKSNR